MRPAHMVLAYNNFLGAICKLLKRKKATAGVAFLFGV